MDEPKIGWIFGALMILLIVVGAVGLRHWLASICGSIVAYMSRIAARSSVTLRVTEQPDTNGLPQSNILEIPGNGSQPNILELPKASANFVGVWGGYTHSTVYSVVPGALALKGPDRISVTFGRQGDSVFIASELYTGPHQQIVGKPHASMANPSEALVSYKARDRELDYVYLHRFKLLGSGKIAYSQKVEIYDRRAHALLGRASQHALLAQLTTAEQWVKFSRPAPFEVSHGEISVGRSFNPAR